MSQWPSHTHAQMKLTSFTEVPKDCVSTTIEHKCMSSTHFRIFLPWLKGKFIWYAACIKRDAKLAGCPVVAGPVVRSMAAQARYPFPDGCQHVTFLHEMFVTAHIKFVGMLEQCRLELPPAIHTLILVYK